MPHYPDRTIRTGEKYQVAGLRILQLDLTIHSGEINRLPGNNDAEMVKNVGDKARTIKSFGRIN